MSAKAHNLRIGNQGMFITEPLSKNLYLTTDETGRFISLHRGSLGWNVFVCDTQEFIAKGLDNFDEAEGTAYEYLTKVSA